MARFENNNNTIKLLAGCSAFMLMMAALLAWNNPATGYELDIYASTPVFTWIFLGIAIIIGVGIVVHQVVTKGYENSRIWALGLLILIISRFVLLYIPYIRGYVTWHGDNITHWGYIRNLIDSGHFLSDNYYPVTHTYLAQTILVTGLPIGLVANVSTAVFSVFFVIFTYLLAAAVLTEKGQQIIATLIAGAVMLEGGYHVFLMPNGWSILMLPLLFYLYVKSNLHLYNILLFIMLLCMYPFFHPLSGLMLVYMLLFIFLVSLLVNFVLKKKQADFKSLIDLTYQAVLLESVILITWILSFNSFRPNIRLIWQQITSGGPQVLMDMSDTLVKINMRGLNAVILFFKLYGVHAILIFLSLCGMVLLFQKVKRGNNKQEFRTLLVIGIPFLFAGLLYLLYLLGFPGLESIGAPRILSYIVLFTPILAGFILYEFNQKIRVRFVSVVVISFLVLISAGLSYLNLYYSPYNIKPNGEITNADMDGAAWFINNKSQVRVMANASEPQRFTMIISEPKPIGAILPIPDHFTYDSSDYLGLKLEKPAYLTLNMIDRLEYLTVWKTVGRFVAEDFIKLEDDITVNKLYDNGEYTIYFIVPFTSQ